jgi:hypothetical protein
MSEIKFVDTADIDDTIKQFNYTTSTSVLGPWMRDVKEIDIDKPIEVGVIMHHELYGKKLLMVIKHMNKKGNNCIDLDAIIDSDSMKTRQIRYSQHLTDLLANYKAAHDNKEPRVFIPVTIDIHPGMGISDIIFQYEGKYLYTDGECMEILNKLSVTIRNVEPNVPREPIIDYLMHFR